MTQDDDLRFPSHVLREYAFIADGERGALIGPSGDIVWLCAPGWSSDAVFSSLIGGPGAYAVSPQGRFVWGGYYEAGSLVWRSRWITDSGIIECREALSFPGDPDQVTVLRRIIAVEGDAHVHIALDLRSGFGEHVSSDLKRSENGAWTARSGSVNWRWRGADEATLSADGQVLRCDLTLRAGEHHDLVLDLAETPLKDPVDPTVAWASTAEAWREAVPGIESIVANEDVQHSHAVLRGLTTSRGGMVAAATMSLPERARAGRNYDYRYVWIRDQCYAGQAVASLGAYPLMDDATRFVAERLLEDGPNIKPAYTPSGGPVPDERQLGLPGYPGGYDRVGNWVNQQFQLDVFGEALLLLAAAARHDRLDADGRRAVDVAVGAIAKRRHDVDAGVWEIDDRAWTHSRLICAAGLRAAARDVASAHEAAQWSALADTIVAETSATSLHRSGRWQRSPNDPGLDAALLMAGVRGAVGAQDPRTRSTLDAFRHELTTDYYAYRFRHDDRALYESEGAFLLCGFMMSLAEIQQGNRVEAFRWFERNRSACGPPGLFAEEYDVVERQLRGNLPQGFVHALMMEAAARLGSPADVA